MGRGGLQGRLGERKGVASWEIDALLGSGLGRYVCRLLQFTLRALGWTTGILWRWTM